MGAQPVAQRPLIARQMFRRFRFADAKLIESLACTGFGDTPRLLDSFLEVFAERSFQGRHTLAHQFTSTGPLAILAISVAFCRSIHASTSTGLRSVERSSITV